MNKTQMIKRAYVRGLAARGIYRARLRQKQAAGGLKDYAISGGIGAAGGGALGSLIGALVQYARGKNVLRGALAGGGIGGGLGLLGGLGYQALKGRNSSVDGLPTSLRGMKKFLRNNYGDYGSDADRIAQQAVAIAKSRGNEIMPPNLNPESLKSQSPAARNATIAQAYGRNPNEDEGLLNSLALNATYGVPSLDTLDAIEAADMLASDEANAKGITLSDLQGAGKALNKAIRGQAQKGINATGKILGNTANSAKNGLNALLGAVNPRNWGQAESTDSAEYNAATGFGKSQDSYIDPTLFETDPFEDYFNEQERARLNENSRKARENSKRVVRNNKTRKQEQEERDKAERIRNQNGGGYR